MSKILSIEEYKQRKMQEHMVVPCDPPKKHIKWSPKLTDEQKTRIQESLNRINKIMQELKDASKVQR